MNTSFESLVSNQLRVESREALLAGLDAPHPAQARYKSVATGRFEGFLHGHRRAWATGVAAAVLLTGLSRSANPVAWGSHVLAATHSCVSDVGAGRSGGCVTAWLQPDPSPSVVAVAPSRAPAPAPPPASPTAAPKAIPPWVSPGPSASAPPIPSPTPKATASATPGPVAFHFTDSFTGDHIGQPPPGWTQANWTGGWTVQPNWLVPGGRYVTYQGSSAGSISSTAGANWTDYGASAAVTLGDSTGFGLGFRKNGQLGYSCDVQNGQLILQLDAGSYTKTLAAKPVAVAAGTWYTITAGALSNSLSCNIAGVTIRAQDSTFSQGTIALWIGSNGKFQNVEAYGNRK